MSYLPEGLHNDDFEHMAYNVLAVPTGVNILDHFAELKQYKEFESTFLEIDHNAVLKYVFLMYQKNTPLKKFDDLIRRKMEAALIAGFKFDENGMPSEHGDMVLKGQVFVVNEMVVRLARMQGNTKFAALLIGTEAYYKKLAAITRDTDDDDNGNKSEADIEKVKGELWKQALLMETQLSELANELLNEDNNPYLKKDLFCIVDREQSQLMMPTPERIAKYGKEAIQV